MIIAIAAISKQTRAIGKDGGLVWDLPSDLARFRTLTKGHPVIMGRKTWESLPENRRPLPNRTNIVVTRDPNYKAEGAFVATTIEAARTHAEQSPGADQIWVIGGGEIYKLALPITDELWLTEVDDDVPGDAYFPDYTEFSEETSREEHEENGIRFTFRNMRRPSATPS